jgi:hypothetical protein
MTELRYPAHQKALERCHSKRYPTREQGMRELIALGAMDDVLKVALASAEGGILDLANEALFPEPVELLLHNLTCARGPDANLALRYLLPQSNYLYAQAAIVDVFGSRGKRLTRDAIEGFGLAAMQGMAPAIQKSLFAPLINLNEATRRDGATKAARGVRIFVGDSTDWYLSSDSEKAIAALVALQRLGVSTPMDVLDRMESELRATMRLDNAPSLRYLASLMWVRFDMTGEGLETMLATCESMCLYADIATSMLKRAQHAEVEELVRTIGDVYFDPGGFCHWPLVDFLSSRKLIDLESLSNHPMRCCYTYVRARNRGLAPPPWWNWIGSVD